MFITMDIAGNEVYLKYGYIDYVNGAVNTYTEDEIED